MRRADDAPAISTPAPPRPRTEDLATQVQGRTGIVLLVAVLAVVLAGWLWRRWRTGAPRGPRPTAASAPDLSPGPADLTVHRVRAAYRSALASLAQVGLGRAETETPAEHAARVAALRPELAGALRTLLTVYAPVRYGLSASEQGADEAEAAVGTLARLTSSPLPSQLVPD